MNKKLQAVILLGLALATATFAEVRLQIDGASVPILIFHSVRLYRPTDLKRARRYIVSPYTFDRELGYLKENGYFSVSFDDLAHRLVFGTPLPPKPLIISFDDGWASQYQYALMQIGCHSESHPFLTRIKSEEALRKEIFGAKQIIETHLKKTVTAYDYPFGLYNAHIIDLVKEAGFVCARGTAPGIFHTHDELFTLTSLGQTARAPDAPMPERRQESLLKLMVELP